MNKLEFYLSINILLCIAGILSSLAISTLTNLIALNYILTFGTMLVINSILWKHFKHATKTKWIKEKK